MAVRLAEILGIPDGAPHLDEALTHPSFANEVRDVRHYQRLELLGDAVLGLCSAELLYERFPTADEGTLTRHRAALVNAEALAAFAREIGLGAELRLGRGADAGGLRDSTSVLADAVEALLAVAYLAGGMPGARQACARILEPALLVLECDGGLDPKSQLQEQVQQSGGPPPAYEVTGSGGAAHEPWFSVAVSVNGRALGQGNGRSKRLAERAAARAALDALASEGAVRPRAPEEFA